MNKQKKRKIYIVFGFAVIVTFIFYVISNADGDLLKVTFLNVGDGNAVFVWTPNGNNILINAGGDASVLQALGRVMPFYERSIDAVFATDGSQSSSGGLPEVLKNYQIGEYFKTGSLQTGNSIDLGGGVFLKILFTGNDKNFGQSIAAEIVYGKTKFLIMPNDISENTENYLAETFSGALKSDILGVSHNGADGYLSGTFLSAVSPRFSVVNVSKNNKYGYPAQDTLSLLTGIKSTVFETYNGDVTFISDAKSVLNI